MNNNRSKVEVHVQPLEFPMPTVKPCALRRISLSIRNKIETKSALETANGNMYEIGRVLKDAIYGHVYHAVLVHPITDPALLPSISAGQTQSVATNQTATTNQTLTSNAVVYARSDPVTQIALKVYSKDRIRQYRGKTQENPIKELSSMQFLGDHPNIMQQIECVEDRENIYSVMPFCDGGELYDIIEAKGAINETMARYYFIQILQGVAYLQSRGVAHRDMSLENIMFDSNGRCFIIDFGMCLRLPVEPTENEQFMEILRKKRARSGLGSGSDAESDGDVMLPSCEADMMEMELSPPPPPPLAVSREGSADSNRGQLGMDNSPNNPMQIPEMFSVQDVLDSIALVIPAHGVCGKRNYIAPEVLDHSPNFEPLLVDIWALGIILFIMLTGVPPVDTATQLDQRYRLICGGYLSNMLEQWGIRISGDAIDLISNILKPDPKDRLTIQQILSHPWTLKQATS